jgi:hypothetical protein
VLQVHLLRDFICVLVREHNVFFNSLPVPLKASSSSSGAALDVVFVDELDGELGPCCIVSFANGPDEGFFWWESGCCAFTRGSSGVRLGGQK